MKINTRTMNFIKMKSELHQTRSRVKDFLRDYRKLEKEYPDIIIDTDDGCPLTMLIDTQKDRGNFEVKYFGVLTKEDSFISTKVRDCELFASYDTKKRFKEQLTL